MERLDCPACNRSLQHQGDLAGQQLKCPACGEVFETHPLPGAAPFPSPTEPLRLPSNPIPQAKVRKPHIGMTRWLIVVGVVAVVLAAAYLMNAGALRQEQRGASLQPGDQISGTG